MRISPWTPVITTPPRSLEPSTERKRHISLSACSMVYQRSELTLFLLYLLLLSLPSILHFLCLPAGRHLQLMHTITSILQRPAVGCLAHFFGADFATKHFVQLLNYNLPFLHPCLPGNCAPRAEGAGNHLAGGQKKTRQSVRRDKLAPEAPSA